MCQKHNFILVIPLEQTALKKMPELSVDGSMREPREACGVVTFSRQLCPQAVTTSRR